MAKRKPNVRLLNVAQATDLLQEQFGASCLDNRAEAFKLAHWIKVQVARAYADGVESKDRNLLG